MDVTLDTVGDSISLEFLLTLLTFMTLFGTRLGSLPSISVVLPVNSRCYPGYSRRFYFLGVSSNLDNLHIWVGTRLGSLLSILVVLPINSGCYPGYSGGFYFLEFLLTLITFMSLFGTRLGSLLRISVVLPVNSGCYHGYSRRFYFLGVSSCLVTRSCLCLVQDLDLSQYIRWSYLSTVNGCYPGYSGGFYFLGVSACLVTLHVCLVQDLDHYSVYQWSYLSAVDVTLDTVVDSISLEFLLALLAFMSLFGTRLGSLLSISVVLPVNSGCYPGYRRGILFPWSFF